MKHEDGAPPIVHRSDQRAKREAAEAGGSHPSPEPNGPGDTPQPTPPPAPSEEQLERGWLDTPIFGSDDDDE
jgi:hypothetical protein